MIRALYTAASGMNAQQANIDNVAHNLSNVNTTGFKKSRVEFEDQKDRRRLRIQLDVPLGQAEERLVEDLAALEGVVAVRWAE